MLNQSGSLVPVPNHSRLQARRQEGGGNKSRRPSGSAVPGRHPLALCLLNLLPRPEMFQKGRFVYLNLWNQTEKLPTTFFSEPGVQTAHPKKIISLDKTISYKTRYHKLKLNWSNCEDIRHFLLYGGVREGMKARS